MLCILQRLILEKPVLLCRDNIVDTLTHDDAKKTTEKKLHRLLLGLSHQTVYTLYMYILLY